MSADHLFTLPSDTFKVTSDDCYTPRWVFDAMGLRFDLDVAAPKGGPWHVPADRYYTAEDDGLAQPWDGLVWCNPPYSSFEVWADRWLAHPTGVLLGYQLPQVRWTRKVFAGADARRGPRMRNTTRPMPVTRELRLALDAWNRANQRARSEYTTHPTVSGGYCEWCWHTSKVSPCRVCGKEESA